MRLKRLSLLLGLLLLLVTGLFSGGILSGGGLSNLANRQVQAGPTRVANPPFPDAYKLSPKQPPGASVPGIYAPGSLTHPCGQMYPAPPFTGLSPLAIAYPYTNCPNTNAMGDVATWQYNGHDYVGLSGFGYRMFYLYNVDDPYNPILLKEQTFPSGGTASLSIFDWKQNGNQYLSVTMRGSSPGCGFFVYNINDPANPQFVGRKQGSDWCTVHEHFVSLDTNGNADYAWLAMSGEGGSGYKIVALDIHDLSNMVETGRYQRPDAGGNIFVHDSNVVGNRVYVGHWAGGMLVFDKDTLAHNVNPSPLNPIDSIRPQPFGSFWVHHTVPTTDGRYAFIEDEFINTPGQGKVKMYDVSNINSPTFVADISGGDPIAEANQAHNMVIKPLGPGLDLLMVAWYKAGIRGYKVNTNVNPPTITQVFSHQLFNSPQYGNGGFGNVWGVDNLPCTVRGLPRTCLYTGDLMYGLVVDAVNTDTFQPDPQLDPYIPESHITAPANGETITTCNYSIQGLGSDYWSGLRRVEVSLDNGATWHTAEGTTNWSYKWVIQAAGQYILKVRGIDMANNIETPTNPITVNVTANCPLTTPTVLPTNTNTPIMPTNTPTNTPIPTSTAIAPTNTNTPIPTTSTPIAPTNTPIVPTNTPVAPTSTSIAPTSTSTAIAPTSTPVIPTPTSIPATATPTTCTVGFTDVPPDSTFYGYIQCMACLGIVNGYPDGTFHPDSFVTRSQFAKIIALSAGINDPVPSNQQTFEDVLPGSTFWQYVERLSMHSVMSGYECGGEGEPCVLPGNRRYFRTGGNALRGQTTKFISNTANWNDPIPPDRQTFEDVPYGSPFWLYVERLVLHAPAGTLVGYACGGPGEPCMPGSRPYLRPTSPVTRGQSTKLVTRIFIASCPASAK